MKNTVAILSITLLGLASCGGDTGNPTSTHSNTTVVKDDSPYNAGKIVYQKTCITCHQSDGKGLQGTYPPLAGSDYLLADKLRAIRLVLKGSSGKITVNGNEYQGVMTPQVLNDNDVAQVLNYVYHSFGNNGPSVNPSEVKSVRDTLK